MFSPARIEAELTNLSGIPLSTQTTHPLEDRGDTSVWDTRIEAFSLEGDVLLHLEAYFLPSSAYPGNAAFLDPSSFGLIVGSSGEAFWEAPSSCAPEELNSYSTPGGFPQRSWYTPPKEKGCSVAATSGPVGWLGMLGGLLVAARRRRLTPRG